MTADGAAGRPCPFGPPLQFDHEHDHDHEHEQEHDDEEEEIIFHRFGGAR